MGTRCTRFISDDCSPGTIFSGLAGPVRRRLPQRREDFRHQDYGTSGKAQKGRIKRINTNFPPPKTPSTSTIEHGVPPAGLSQNKAIIRPPPTISDQGCSRDTRRSAVMMTTTSDTRREQDILRVPRVPAQATGRLLTRLEITVLPRVPPGGGHVLLLYLKERTFDA